MNVKLLETYRVLANSIEQAKTKKELSEIEVSEDKLISVIEHLDTIAVSDVSLIFKVKNILEEMKIKKMSEVENIVKAVVKHDGYSLTTFSKMYKYLGLQYTETLPEFKDGTEVIVLRQLKDHISGYDRTVCLIEDKNKNVSLIVKEGLTFLP